MKKITTLLFGMLLSITSASAIASEKLDKLVLSGPFASVSNPLIRMVESGALDDVAKEVSFVVWRSPDQMRAMTLNGDVDFMATPTNVAANLYNRGADIRLLNVSVWGILWMISRDENLKTLADFKGKSLVLPFRGDMPDIVFQQLVKAANLDIKKDFDINYVASPLDAMQMLITRRADHVLLAEPAASMALRKTKSFPISIVAPELHRSVDLQSEWGRLFQRESRMPQAGMSVVNKDLPKAVVNRFIEEYAKATQWCLDNPDEAGKIVAERIDMLTPEAVSDSIKTSRLEAVTATDARQELEYFFDLLKASTPALIGGKLPDAGFYYAPTAQ